MITPVGVDHDRLAEAEFFDARRDGVHRVVVDPRVARIGAD